MPLIVLTGFPSSGKSTRAAELVKYFEEQPERPIIWLNEEQYLKNSKDETYGSSLNEKDLRGRLKSDCQKHLNRETVVILDALNYIKGYRYELYCVAKSAQTPQCCIWCDISKDQAMQFNQAKSSLKYADACMEGLFGRYETPSDSRRWENPLFILHAGDELPFGKINDALFNTRAANPNMSTVAQPLQPTDFMYDLNRVTASIIEQVNTAQKRAVPGEVIKVSIEGTGVVILKRHVTTAEMHKLKRQFLQYVKLNPASADKLAAIFINYLNSNT